MYLKYFIIVILPVTSRIQVSLTNVIIKTEKSPGVCMELAIERYADDILPVDIVAFLFLFSLLHKA